jgi:hypothetical protein
MLQDDDDELDFEDAADDNQIDDVSIHSSTASTANGVLAPLLKIHQKQKLILRLEIPCQN